VSPRPASCNLLLNPQTPSMSLLTNATSLLIHPSPLKHRLLSSPLTKLVLPHPSQLNRCRVVNNPSFLRRPLQPQTSSLLSSTTAASPLVPSLPRLHASCPLRPYCSSFALLEHGPFLSCRYHRLLLAGPSSTTASLLSSSTPQSPFESSSFVSSSNTGSLPVFLGCHLCPQLSWPRHLQALSPSLSSTANFISAANCKLFPEPRHVPAVHHSSSSQRKFPSVSSSSAGSSPIIRNCSLLPCHFQSQALCLWSSTAGLLPVFCSFINNKYDLHPCRRPPFLCGLRPRLLSLAGSISVFSFEATASKSSSPGFPCRYHRRLLAMSFSIAVSLSSSIGIAMLRIVLNSRRLCACYPELQDHSHLHASGLIVITTVSLPFLLNCSMLLL
jgi:hypothetical protein